MACHKAAGSSCNRVSLPSSFSVPPMGDFCPTIWVPITLSWENRSGAENSFPTPPPPAKPLSPL